jgi:hypothetical protein
VRTEIVQLVPNLREHGGVASFARALAAGLAERGRDTRFLVAAGESVVRCTGAGTLIVERSANELLRALEDCGTERVLLHYSNYGYATRGCPLWLVAGVERWRALGDSRRLITVFHELYATGHPLQSSFWLSPVQRHLARRLGRASDAAVTSVGRYGEKLRQWRPDQVIEVLPVFSSAGETVNPVPLSARPPQMLVFGSAGLRARAYGDLVGPMVDACRALQIERIVDVGPGEVAPKFVDGLPVDRRGFLESEPLQAALAACRAGFLAYPSAFLAKSSVYAAYCAFALVPVCAWPSGALADDAQPRWRDGCASTLDQWQQIALRGYAWYSGHSLAQHVGIYGSLLQ